MNYRQRCRDGHRIIDQIRILLLELAQNVSSDILAGIHIIIRRLHKLRLDIHKNRIVFVEIL